MAPGIRLREVVPDDLATHFVQQSDPVANRLSGVGARDRAAYDAHWARNLKDPSITLRTVEVDGLVAGNMVSWLLDGSRVVGYWLGREYWGQGIASAALAQFLLQVRSRPLHAHVALHNPASLRVLQKCGFHIVGTGHFIGLDGEACQEYILRLDE